MSAPHRKLSEIRADLSNATDCVGILLCQLAKARKRVASLKSEQRRARKGAK